MITRERFFKIVTYSIPVLFFVLLELGLRLGGFGKTVPLFIENPDAPNYLLPKPDVVKRYFYNEEAAPNVTIEANFFLKEKPEDGLRIVVQGGSTAAGFPFGFGASIAGMLDYRLKQSFPERSVEVISTALSAVNSYTLLDFSDEIIEQQPDAVLIYAGHNEYLGIMGVGSAYTAANSRGATLTYLKLKNLRIFQLLQMAYSAWSEPEVTQGDRKSRTMMAKVAKHRNIATDSSLFTEGLEQYKGNMQLLLTKYQQAGIPVVISTIESNLADQWPFASSEASNEAANKLTNELVALYQAGQGKQALSALKNLTPAQLLSLEKEAQADVAKAAFVLGKYFQNKGRYDKARQAFNTAKQHDLLRFRAPQQVNQIIRDLAQEFDLTLVDAQQALAQASPNSLVGSEMMIEHLHPTVDGYFEIANAFYDGLVKSNLLGQFPQVIDKNQAEQDKPIFAAEQYWGQAKIAGLMADYPFTSKPTTPVYPTRNNWSDELGYAAFKKQKSWLDIAMVNRQVSAKNKDVVGYLKSLKLLADAMPNDVTLNFNAGTELIKFQQPAQGLRYLKRVLIEKPEDINARLALAHAYSELKQYNKTQEYLRQVLEIQPDNPTAKENFAAISAFLERS